MATLAQPTIKAKYATVYDEAVTIVRGQGGGLYVVYEDSRIEPFTVALAPFTVVLGDVSLAETQAMWDRVSGGAVRIACERLQEVA